MQSRYYDPAIGRFLNADILVSTGQGLLGCNMFAYCLNNPICRYDQTGAFSTLIGYASFENGTSVHFASKGNKEWKSRTNKPKNSEKRKPTGDRERNKKHPNGEEHSRTPKGNGMPISRCLGDYSQGIMVYENEPITIEFWDLIIPYISSPHDRLDLSVSTREMNNLTETGLYAGLCIFVAAIGSAGDVVKATWGYDMSDNL